MHGYGRVNERTHRRERANVWTLWYRHVEVLMLKVLTSWYLRVKVPPRGGTDASTWLHGGIDA